MPATFEHPESTTHKFTRNNTSMVVLRLGVNILGQFPPTVGQVKFLIVAIDYFTKWIKAEPVVTITAQKVKRFYLKKLICRFGVLKTIITDNST